jgi:hypothetical protein
VRVCDFLISLKKTEVFSGPFGACPGQKIGTIFCPKGGLAVVIIKTSRPKQKKRKIGTIFWEQTFRFVTPKGPFLKRHEGGLGQDF